ncbi:MAG: (2Fe-2S)-binding protein [Phycisphaerales bacterium]|nr:MAG: (2Fe-2S)-binding protein [Phycisphaerales bacterium]
MNLDDDICYCYHVSMRKLIRFARRTRPRVPSQMTECLGAGTGCGWCIPFLCRIAADPDGFTLEEVQSEDYARQRQGYIVEKKPKNTFTSDPRDPSEG